MRIDTYTRAKRTNDNIERKTNGNLFLVAREETVQTPETEESVQSRETLDLAKQTAHGT